MILDRSLHLAPVMALSFDVPPKVTRILARLPAKRCIMHELLRDAPNIDAGPTEPPARSGRGSRHVVEEGHFGAVLGRLFSRGETPGPTSNNDEIVFLGVKHTWCAHTVATRQLAANFLFSKGFNGSQEGSCHRSLTHSPWGSSRFLPW